MGVLQDYREQFPQYGKLTDEELSDALYQTYYKDKMDEQDFYEFLGHDPMEPLRAHAQSNISAGTLVETPEGSASVRSGSVQDERLNQGRPTLIPWQWEGRIIEDQEEAVQRAVDSGIRWPHFETDELATEASKLLSGSLSTQIDQKLDSAETRNKEPMAEQPWETQGRAFLDQQRDEEPMFVNPGPDDVGFFTNAVRLTGQRLAGLAGNLIEAGAQTLTDPLAASFTSNPELARELIERGNPVFQFGHRLKNIEMRGRKTAGPESITKAFMRREISETLWEVLKFGIESGIESIADMVVVMRTMPLYVVARSREMGVTKAKLDGRTHASAQDTYESLPFMLGSALLERFGAKGILEAGKDMTTEVGKEALKYALAKVGKAGLKATGREAGTELVQEGIIEYIGERWGTEAAMEWREGLTRGLWASLAGGTFGLAAGTTAATGEELTRRYDERNQIPEEFAAPPPKVAPPIIAPETPQEPVGEPEPEPGPTDIDEPGVSPPRQPPADDAELLQEYSKFLNEVRENINENNAAEMIETWEGWIERLPEPMRPAQIAIMEETTTKREPTGTAGNEEFRTAREAAKAAVGDDTDALNEIMDIEEEHLLGTLDQDEAIERLRNVKPAETEVSPESDVEAEIIAALQKVRGWGESMTADKMKVSEEDILDLTRRAPDWASKEDMAAAYWQGTLEEGPPVVHEPAAQDRRAGVTGQAGTFQGWRAEGTNVYNTSAQPGAAEPIAGPGRYVALTESGAKEFGDDVHEESIELENPFVIQSDEEWQALTKEVGWKFPNPFGQVPGAVRRQTEELQQYLKDKGYDGLVVTWDNTSETDMDGDKGIKTLRNVFSVPQAVKFEAEPSPEPEAEPVAGTEIRSVEEALAKLNNPQQAEFIKEYGVGSGGNRFGSFKIMGRTVEVRTRTGDEQHFAGRKEMREAAVRKWFNDVAPKPEPTTAEVAPISEDAELLKPYDPKPLKYKPGEMGFNPKADMWIEVEGDYAFTNGHMVDLGNKEYWKKKIKRFGDRPTLKKESIDNILEPLRDRKKTIEITPTEQATDEAAQGPSTLIVLRDAKGVPRYVDRKYIDKFVELYGADITYRQATSRDRVHENIIGVYKGTKIVGAIGDLVGAVMPFRASDRIQKVAKMGGPKAPVVEIRPPEPAPEPTPEPTEGRRLEDEEMQRERTVPDDDPTLRKLELASIELSDQFPEIGFDGFFDEYIDYLVEFANREGVAAALADYYEIGDDMPAVQQALATIEKEVNAPARPDIPAGMPALPEILTLNATDLGQRYNAKELQVLATRVGGLRQNKKENIRFIVDLGNRIREIDAAELVEIDPDDMSTAERKKVKPLKDSTKRFANARFKPGFSHYTVGEGYTGWLQNLLSFRNQVVELLGGQKTESKVQSASTTQASWDPGTNHVAHIGKLNPLPLTPNREYHLVSKDGPVTIPKRPLRRSHIIKKLEQIFGVHIYTGKVKGKTRLGFYKTLIGELRTKYVNDLEVTAHELGHWFDDRYPWIKTLYKQHTAEMKGVSYDVEKTNEGFAEFMRLFFTQEHEAYQAAPEFFDAFMNELSGKPYAEGVFQVQEMMHAWFLQGPRARGASKIGPDDTPLSQRAMEEREAVSDRMLFETLDELRPFYTAEMDITGGMGIANHSGYKSLRLARGQRAVMDAVWNKGTIGWDEDGDIVFTGMGFKDVHLRVEGLMEEYQQYMVGRRAEELLAQGRENHFRPDEVKSFLAWGEQYPVFKEVFQDWLDFSDRMMDFYQDSGIISPAKRKMIEEMNKNYVPFNRIIDAAQALGRSKGARGKVASPKGASPFMRLRGGTTNIGNPFDNIVGNTSHLIHMALVNRGKENFYKMIDNADQQSGALYAVRVPKEATPVKVTSNQVIQSVVEGLGWTMSKYRLASLMPESEQEAAIVELIDMIYESMGDFVSFFEVGQAPKGRIDSYLKDGEQVFYEIGDPLLYDAINQIGPKSHNLAVNLLGGFSNILRTGVTMTPTFQIKNFIRDSMNAWTLSRGQMIPAVGAMKQLVSRMWDNELYWEYMANGGGFSSMADAEGINRDKIMHGPKNVWERWKTAMGAFEYANRLSEYTALRKKGYTKREAAFLGREISTDFAMRGASESLRVLTIGVPFMNARLQGNYRIAREVGSLQDGKLKSAGIQTFSYALRAFTAITVPSIVLYLFNKDDERYQELSDHLKDLNWIIFFGPAEDDYLMIPKPFETGMMFGSLPERMFELWEKRDGKEFTDAAGWLFMESFGLDFVPQLFGPAYDLAVNETFTGAPVIPEYMKGIEPAEQFRHYTSDAMVALGRKMNISPIQAEYLIRGYLGTLGAWGLAAADSAVNVIHGTDYSSGATAPGDGWSWRDNFLMDPFVNKGPLRRTDSQQDFYEMLHATEITVKTMAHMQGASPRRLLDYLSEPEQQAFIGVNAKLRDVSVKARAINFKMDAVVRDESMSGKEKQELIHELMRARNQLFRAIGKELGRKKIKELEESLGEK